MSVEWMRREGLLRRERQILHVSRREVEARVRHAELGFELGAALRAMVCREPGWWEERERRIVAALEKDKQRRIRSERARAAYQKGLESQRRQRQSRAAFPWHETYPVNEQDGEDLEQRPILAFGEDVFAQMLEERR